MTNESRIFYAVGLFLFTATFISTIFGYLGILNYIYILPLSLALTYFINKKCINGKTEKTDKKEYFFAFVFTIPILLIFINLKIIPEQGGADLYTRLSVSKLYSEEMEITKPYGLYPKGTDSLLAFLIQPLPKYFVFTTFIFEIFLTYMSFLALYKLTKLITKKSSIMPLFFYSLSIFPLWILEQGYISFLLGSFFFLSFLLAIKEYETEKNKRLLLLASIFTAGTFIVYPHFSFLIAVFVLLSKTKQYYRMLFIGFVMSLFEFIQIMAGYLEGVNGEIEHIAGLTLIPGGILNPTPFALIALIFAGLLGFKEFIKNKNYSFLRKWVNSYLFLFILIVVMFCINLFVRVRDDHLVSEREFYIIIKFFYTLMQPAAIICLFGIDNLKEKIKSGKKGLKIIQYGIIGYHLFFGLGYVGVLLFSGTVFPVEFYMELDYLRNTIKGEPITIEPCLINKTEINKPYIYSSFYDLPSNWTDNKIARLYKLFRTKETGINYNITIGYSQEGYMLYNCNNITLVKKN